MCTVTFFPNESGYIVAMNRDDLYARARTLAPAVVRTGDRSSIFPSEAGGGTWIGANDTGITLCLLNWDRPAIPKLRSRGEVIPQLLVSDSLHGIDLQLGTLSLAGALPFRLVGFSLNERAVLEWRWDASSIVKPQSFAWELNHWFSSGLSDERARENRLPLCREAISQPDACTIEWLRRLHRSHSPEPGAFSICAHRQQGGTLSYTELAVFPEVVEVHHTDASPCKEKTMISSSLLIASHNTSRNR